MPGFHFAQHLRTILGVDAAGEPRPPFAVAADLEIYDQEIEDALTLAVSAVNFYPDIDRAAVRLIDNGLTMVLDAFGVASRNFGYGSAVNLRTGAVFAAPPSRLGLSYVLDSATHQLTATEVGVWHVVHQLLLLQVTPPDGLWWLQSQGVGGTTGTTMFGPLSGASPTVRLYQATVSDVIALDVGGVMYGRMTVGAGTPAATYTMNVRSHVARLA